MNLLKPKLILVWILKINVFITLERWIIKKRIIYFLYTCVLEKMMIWSKHPCNNPWDYTLSRVQRLVEFWLQACNMHLNIKNLKNHYLASHYVHIYIDTNIDQRLAQQLHQGLVRSWIKRIRMMCRWIRGTSSFYVCKIEIDQHFYLQNHPYSCNNWFGNKGLKHGVGILYFTLYYIVHD